MLLKRGNCSGTSVKLYHGKGKHLQMIVLQIIQWYATHIGKYPENSTMNEILYHFVIVVPPSFPIVPSLSSPIPKTCLSVAAWMD